MVVNLSKEFITEKILAFFPEKKLARKTKAPLWQIVKAIIYRLKTGCQWRELPIQSFFVRSSNLLANSILLLQ
nr:transposase [Saprospira grandis]